MPVVINGTTGISGNDGSAATPTLQGTDTNTGVFFPAADTVAIATGGTEGLRVDPSRNLMVGTTTNTNNSRIVSNGVIESTSGGVRFPDGTTQTTARTASNTVTSVNGQVGAVTVSSSPPTDFEAIGTYAVLMNTTNSNIATGATVAGSNLRYNQGSNSTVIRDDVPFAGTRQRVGTNAYDGGGTAPAGTWRKMSTGSTYFNNGYNQYFWFNALYVRVS